MQILRCILWVSVTATLLSPLALSAQDAADSKLQEALQKKVKELEPPPAATPPAAMPPSAPQKPPMTTPAPAKPVAPTIAQVAAPVVANPQDDDKMRDALRRKMNQLDTETRPAPVVPPPAPSRMSEPVYQPLPGSNPPSAKTVIQPAKPTTSEPKKVQSKPAATPQQSDRNAAIAAAVAQANADQAKSTDRSMSGPSAAQKERPVAAPRAPLVLPPIQGPPSSLSGSQQARLQTLDQQYMADLISSEQYHARRAKIVAEP